MGPQASWIEVGPENAETRLVLYPKSMMPNWAELKPSIVFFCEDIEGTCERFRQNGVEITEGPTRMSWGTYAKFRDPDGNEFLLKE
jgi:predicted enzyme related to lactoylglutathione lyase